MTDNFERLYMGISAIYKNIQKIKKSEMSIFGLSGKHVMPFYNLLNHPEGLTSAELCTLCNADRAGISRALSEMEKEGYIYFDDNEGKKRYRSLVFLTEEGKKKAENIRQIILQATLEGGQTITQEEREIFYHVLECINHNIEHICNTEVSKNK